jgi:hypothetical protein
MSPTISQQVLPHIKPTRPSVPQTWYCVVPGSTLGATVCSMCCQRLVRFCCSDSDYRRRSDTACTPRRKPSYSRDTAHTRVHPPGISKSGGRTRGSPSGGRAPALLGSPAVDGPWVHRRRHCGPHLLRRGGAAAPRPTAGICTSSKPRRRGSKTVSRTGMLEEETIVSVCQVSKP